MRRNAEEIERCALRCHTEESVALQTFLAGFHEAVESRLERQRTYCIKLVEALEQRFEAETGRLIRCEIAVEARRAVQEALEELEQSINASSAVDVVASKAQKQREGSSTMKGMAQIGVELKASAKAAAEAAVLGVVGGVGGDLAELRSELAAEAARRQSEVRELLCRLDSTEGSLSATAAVAEAAAGCLHDWGTNAAVRIPCVEELDANVAKVRESYSAGLRELEASCAHTYQHAANAQLAEERLRENVLADVEALMGGLRQYSVRGPAHLEGLIAAHSLEVAAATANLRDELTDTELLLREETASNFAALQIAEAGLESQIEARARSVEFAVTEGMKQMTSNLQKLRTDAFEEVASARSGAAELLAGASVDLGNAVSERVAGGVKALETIQEEMGSLDARIDRRLQEEQSRIQSVWRPEAKRLGSEVKELRSETRASASQWRATAADNAQALGSLQATCKQFEAVLADLQQRSLAHDWLVPKCMQRLQYLAMDKDSGVWLDSPEFMLGCLGSLVLRLYPRGSKPGDGQCAVGLRSRGNSRTVPLQLDLYIGGLRRRAVARVEEDGATLFLAEGFGSLESHLQDSDDLKVGVEVPSHAWGGLHGRNASSSSESVEVQARFNSTSSQYPRIEAPEAEVSSGASLADAMWQGSRPKSTGMIGRSLTSRPAYGQVQRSLQSPGGLDSLRPGWAFFGEDGLESPARNAKAADRDRTVPDHRGAGAAAPAAKALEEFSSTGSTTPLQGESGARRIFPSTSPWSSSERRAPTNPFDDM